MSRSQVALATCTPRCGCGSEAGELTVDIDWEMGVMLSASVEGVHQYAFPADGAPYNALVRVTDPAGLSDEKQVVITVTDIPTAIREVSTSIISEGTVSIVVDAADADTDDLVYQFDMDNDGEADGDAGRRSSIRHLFNGRYLQFWCHGDRPLVGRFCVRDVRSDCTRMGKPSADCLPDHIQTKEGEWVLRVAAGAIESSLDADVCERDVNPDAMLWAWSLVMARWAMALKSAIGIVMKASIASRSVGGPQIYR